MLKPFILVYDPFELPRDEILDFLDTLQEVKNYFAFLPTSIVIISDQTTSQLSKIFRREFERTLFFISAIPHGGYDGWLDKEFWNFINNPSSSERWPEF